MVGAERTERTGRHARTGRKNVGRLVVAGGLGNAIDRLAHGHVVDFIHLHHWPIFNVADILLVAGAIALAIGTRRPSTPVPG